MANEHVANSDFLNDAVLVQDRKAFLDVVRLECADSDRTLAAYQRALDELLSWTLTKSDILQLKPRGNDVQYTVRFCVAGTSRIFWAAYPRPTKQDAKLMAVQDECGDLPSFIRDNIRSQFAELDRDESSERIPTVSFQVLKASSSVAKIISCLEQALTDIRKHLRR